MSRRGLLIVVGALAAAGAAAAVSWPRINDVETGRTPEYPDLQPREYKAGMDRITRTVEDASKALPRWTFVGSASGPGGTRIQLLHKTLVFRFEDDVTVSLKPRTGGLTTVSVRSRSKVGQWDFGQNARNIRELLAELDRRLGTRPADGAGS